MLEVKNLFFEYDEANPILQNISFKLEKGEFVSIIGESGCGKSTLMKLIYGLYNWNKGEILFEGNSLFGPNSNLIPGEKYMKYVAQDFNLMPNHTVYENVGKFISNSDLVAKEKLIFSCLKTVELKEFSDKKVKFLSGGQQQRVALAVALSQQPKILLLDEPFSQIDNFRKSKLRRKIFNFVKKKNISTLLITHDMDDALGFSDRIVVMKNGKFLQENTSENIYKFPKNEYVARLFGEINCMNGEDFGLQFKKIFVYFHQLIESDSGIKVEIVSSLFRGKDFINEALFKTKKIYFISEERKKNGDSVYLRYKET